MRPPRACWLRPGPWGPGSTSPSPLRQTLLQAIEEAGDRDPLLLHGVALADGDGTVVEGVEVDRDAERGAYLVLAAVAAADVAARLVVLDPEVRAQQALNLTR